LHRQREAEPLVEASVLEAAQVVAAEGDALHVRRDALRPHDLGVHEARLGVQNVNVAHRFPLFGAAEGVAAN
jgi:hypothetical protein